MSSAEAEVDEHLDAILQACEEGDEKWLEELLDDKNHGNMIDTKDPDGYTPIVIASNYGQNGIVKTLLERNADPSIAANDGGTALLCAVQGKHIEVVRTLLNDPLVEVDPKCTTSSTAPKPLYTACQESADAIVFLLVSRGADVNITHEGTSPLYVAAQLGNRKVCSTLLNAGAKVNLGSKATGASPLIVSVKNNHKKVARRLLQDPKVDVNCQMTKTGSTPLLIAIKKGKEGRDFLSMLLDAKADVEKKDKRGDSPLIKAAWYGDRVTIGQLIRCGAKLDPVDADGQTAGTILLNEHDEDIEELVGSSSRRNSKISSLMQPTTLQTTERKMDMHTPLAPAAAVNLDSRNFRRRGSAAPLPGIGNAPLGNAPPLHQRHSTRNLHSNAPQNLRPNFNRANSLSTINFAGGGGALRPLQPPNHQKKDSGAAVREILASSRQMLITHSTAAV